MTTIGDERQLWLLELRLRVTGCRCDDVLSTCAQSSHTTIYTIDELAEVLDDSPCMEMVWLKKVERKS